MPANALGLYISVPFCRAKCTFCHFASDAFPPARMTAYAARLCRELADAKDFAQRHAMRLPRTVDSVFLGGGTPSLLDPADFAVVFDGIHRDFKVWPDAEITVEAAPGQISDELLSTMLRCGVNRVSLGVQSFVDEESRAVGRSHTGAACRQEIARLFAAGVRTVSVDLIAGLPHQTRASWLQSLRQVVESGVQHASVYMLEVDEDSRLGRELIGPGIRYGAHAAPTDSVVADMYGDACTTLAEAGLRQYEISNFARDGFASVHNRKYWTRQPYLGAGLDAHSMLEDVETGDAMRFANGDALEAYIGETGGAADERAVERIDALGAWEETIFLGLRLVDGLDVTRLRQRFGAAQVNALLVQAAELTRDGLMQVDGESVRLTHAGRIVSSSIFGELLAHGAAV